LSRVALLGRSRAYVDQVRQCVCDRKIAREAGVGRKTVARYTAAAQKLGIERGHELTDGEVHEVAQCVQSRPLAAPSDEWLEIAQHKERIARWLAGDDTTRALRLTKVHTLLVRDHGLCASYDTLWRFASPSWPPPSLGAARRTSRLRQSRRSRRCLGKATYASFATSSIGRWRCGAQPRGRS
jgi:hypothetical protein